MNNKAIVHIMTKARLEDEAFGPELDAIEDLSEKYWVKNIIFYKWDVLKYDVLISKLEKFHILCRNYSNKEDLKNQVLEISEEYEVIFVSTPLELLVNTVNEVKQALKRPISDNPDVFRDKFLQRELIQNHNPDLGIKFIKGTPEDLDIKEIESHVWYPFIIKPVDWVQSSWVAKIENKKDYQRYIDTYKDFHDRLKSRWVDSKELIVEEFINWKLYSVDYFVTSEGDVRTSKPVKQRILSDIGVNDYWVLARIASEKTEWEFKWKRVKTFVNSTVKACGIRNTFVHHEFKINSKWELKTIELNGRIGWWRLDLLNEAYGMNLYELILNPDLKAGKLKQSNIAVNIYATKRWILDWFNEKLLKRIEERESVYMVKADESAIWKEIWLTKDWFIKIWVIKLENKDYKILAKDYNYIKSKYKDLLDISPLGKIKKESILSKHKKKVKTVFSKVWGLFRWKK